MERLFEHTLNTRPILKNSLRFVRSDVPTQVSAEEKERLIADNITTIVDLRTAAERAERPCPLADDARFTYLCLPVTVGNAVPATAGEVSRLYIAMVDATRCAARSTRYGTRKPMCSIFAPPERIGRALFRRSCSTNPA